MKIESYYFFKIYFGLRSVFVAAHGLSLVAASGGYSWLWCAGFSLWWLFSCCRARALGTRALELRLSSCGARA